MQAVAALRGGFGGHQVMSVSEGDQLRAEGTPGHVKHVQAKAAKKEKPTKSAAKARAKGRQAASAGPSSGSGSTTASGGSAKEATKAGPTSGTGRTRRPSKKSAARKSS